MLMIHMIPLLQMARGSHGQAGRRWLDGLCITILSGLVQLIAQLLGITDLRQMLTITHVLIILSTMLIISLNFAQPFRSQRQEQNRILRHSAEILCLGALADLALYSLTGNSAGLFFFLLSIRIYSLLSGAQIFRSYIQHRHMLEEKETQLTLSRITTMVSQLRSHFVFNILNAISGMCKYDPAKVEDMVLRFVRYLRSNIDILKDDRPLPFAAVLRHLEDYVYLEQVRFGDKIEFVTDILADRFLFPPLILQPVAENTIKHGLRRKRPAALSSCAPGRMRT